jgi:hypothetical protein
MLKKVSQGAYYVCATKVHGCQNCMYPPVTIAAALRDPTSLHGYSSHRGAGAHFAGHEKLFLDQSIFHFLAKNVILQPQQSRLDLSSQAQPWREMFIDAHCPGIHCVR